MLKSPSEQPVHFHFFDRTNGASHPKETGNPYSGERNVNLFSVNHVSAMTFSDTPQAVATNITRCFEGLGAKLDHPKFFLTAQYKGVFSELTPETIEAHLESAQAYRTKQAPAPDTEASPLHILLSLLAEQHIYVLPADGIIVKDFDTPIFVAGAGGDAHPIIMYDEQEAVGAYLSGAHANISAGALESIIHILQPTPSRRVVIGPGLGPDSYEFGENAADVFFKSMTITAPERAACFRPAVRADQSNAILVNFAAVIRVRLSRVGIESTQMNDTRINTLGFSLIADCDVHSQDRLLLIPEAVRQAKAKVAMEQAAYYSARGGTMARGQNPIERADQYYTEQGRHFAGVGMQPHLFQQRAANNAALGKKPSSGETNLSVSAPFL